MINPELTKNLWLEITPHRLYVTPVLILLLSGILYLSADGAIQGGIYLDHLYIIAAFTFACVGGAHYCAYSMINEFADHTWDQQRMSPLSPWTLTWGKLFGGAGFMWYGAVWCLLLLYLTPILLPPYWSWQQRVELTLLVIFFAIFAQATGLLVVINAANSTDKLLRYRRNYGFGLALMGIFAGGYFFAMLADSNASFGIQTWWRQAWPLQEFWLLVVGVFAAWAMMGTYRVMREQMQFRSGCLPWLLFNVFMMVFIAGFFMIPGGEINPHSAIFIAYSVALGLAYTMLISQPLSQPGIRRLVVACGARQWLDIWQNLPLWTVSLSLAALLGIVNLLFHRAAGSSPVPLYLPVALMLFALRDGGVLLFFQVGEKPERAILTGLFYLLLLYTVIPALLLQMGVRTGLGFFWPLYDRHVYILPVGLELVVLCIVIYRRWQGYLGRTLN